MCSTRKASPAGALDLCLGLIIQGYSRTEFLSAAVLILILVIEDSVFWNDLDQRKGLSCDDAASILPSFDIRLDTTSSSRFTSKEQRMASRYSSSV